MSARCILIRGVGQTTDRVRHAIRDGVSANLRCGIVTNPSPGSAVPHRCLGEGEKTIRAIFDRFVAGSCFGSLRVWPSVSGSLQRFGATRPGSGLEPLERPDRRAAQSGDCVPQRAAPARFGIGLCFAVLPCLLAPHRPARSGGAPGPQAASRLRPLARRALMTARPPRVFIRTKKPWVRALRVLDGW